MYYQLFSVVDFVPDPEVSQCFRCQDYGHTHQNCGAEKQKCLRCGDDHRIRDCPRDRNDPCCANCGGRHIASYRGCKSYKAAVQAEKEKLKAGNRQQQQQQSQQQIQGQPPGLSSQPQQRHLQQQQQQQEHPWSNDVLHPDVSQNMNANPEVSSFGMSANTESLVNALSICIQMLVESLKELIANGQSMKEADSRQLARTCVDAFVGQKISIWEKAARERRANIIWQPSGSSTSNLGQESQIH